MTYRPAGARPSIAWRRTGGCDFAVNLGLRGDRVRPIFLPRHDARLALIASAGPLLSAGATALRLDGLSRVESAPEGDYRAGDDRDLLGVLHLAPDGPPDALLIPLDELFADRIAVALRISAAATRKLQPTLTPPTSAQLRRRKLMLRATDADLAGVTYREIALGLFGRKHVPDGSAWRQHHLRSLTIRLVQDGRALMRGGYLRLLRPDRRNR